MSSRQRMERSADVTRTSGGPRLSIGPGAKLETAETVLTSHWPRPESQITRKTWNRHGTRATAPPGWHGQWRTRSRGAPRAQVPADRDAAAGAASSIAGPGARRQ
jgi:hypothetical protein